MTERFYDITHLTTDELRELFTSYRKLGWIDFEFEELRPEDTPPVLSDVEKLTIEQFLIAQSNNLSMN